MNGSFYEDLLCESYFVPKATALGRLPVIPGPLCRQKHVHDRLLQGVEQATHAGCVIEGGNSYLPTACGAYLSAIRANDSIAIAEPA